MTMMIATGMRHQLFGQQRIRRDYFECKQFEGLLQAFLISSKVFTALVATDTAEDAAAATDVAAAVAPVICEVMVYSAQRWSGLVANGEDI